MKEAAAEPAVAAPAVDLEELGPATRPAATLEEHDNEDIDDTLVERLVGLTEIFPDIIKVLSAITINFLIQAKQISHILINIYKVIGINTRHYSVSS